MTTDESIHGIARRAGYDNEASLSKAFKRAFGRSPGEYPQQSEASLVDLNPPSV